MLRRSARLTFGARRNGASSAGATSVRNAAARRLGPCSILAMFVTSLGLIAHTHAATGTVYVSEVAPWSSGNSSLAADWFEITNGTAAPVDITGWRVDDNSNAFASSLALSGATSIAPGESVIFVETAALATTADAFKVIWFGSVAAAPAGLQIGSYSGSSIGLSAGGDEVNIFANDGTSITRVSFGAASAGPIFATFDNTGGTIGAISALSAVGTNGAFAAANPAPAAGQVGSPGTIEGSGGGGPGTTLPVPTTTTPAGPPYQPWPGGSAVQSVDLASTFTGNLSGLDYEGSGSAVPGVIWGALNGPGSLYRLIFDGASWVPDASNGWTNGKALRYPDGTGEPDAEGVTFVGDSSSTDGIYVASERNNLNNTVSRNSILRFDPTAGGSAATLTATTEWNLTGALPGNGSNLGLEGITWIQDSFLVSSGFYDDAKGHTYNPADYPNHGGGLFFVGVEGSGLIYVYALSPDGTFALVTSFSSGFNGVMDLQFDRDNNDLWAVCDNTCTGRMHVLRIGTAGHFEVALRFERPTGMPDTNNEGFAIAPATYCVNGLKPVFWADDADFGDVVTARFSLRVGTLPCEPLVAPPVVVAEFPLAALPIVGTVGIMGVWVFSRRRATAVAG